MALPPPCQASTVPPGPPPVAVPRPATSAAQRPAGTPTPAVRLARSGGDMRASARWVALPARTRPRRTVCGRAGGRPADYAALRPGSAARPRRVHVLRCAPGLAGTAPAVGHRVHRPYPEDRRGTAVAVGGAVPLGHPPAGWCKSSVARQPTVERHPLMRRHPHRRCCLAGRRTRHTSRRPEAAREPAVLVGQLGAWS